ncbi:MAG: type IV secretory system conjugative DNA transfer family protein [Parasphingopyxis sp.]|uniref:type IV secretory system conjugative DNA transfer family protein n=1 Tax=Parasphingopyxis sp. TaxID=1920299 RepID=UPI003F9F265A
MSRIVTIGLANTRRGLRPFGISERDRLNHQYIIGQTGTGKSTLLGTMALQDALAGTGFCLIDPHGDLAGELADRLGDQAMHWRVGDPDCPYGYNPLSRVPSSRRPLVASGFVETLKKQWADSWGPRMEHLLRQAALALLDQPSAHMGDIVRLYVDKEFRRQAIARLVDPQLRSFWTVEFPKMNYLTAIDGVAPIANKIGAFLANPAVRKSLCEPDRPIRFRRAMDEGQLVLISLAKGRVGGDIANVVGGLVMTNILNAAMTRQDMPPEERRPFFLYADEFHAFTTASVADLLSEARKYGLGLIASHQHLSQAERGVIDAVIGNAGTLLSLRIGAQDAPLIARQFGDIEARYFTQLPNYRGFAQLMIEGHKRPVFSFSTLLPATNMGIGRLTRTRHAS